MIEVNKGDIVRLKKNSCGVRVTNHLLIIASDNYQDYYNPGDHAAVKVQYIIKHSANDFGRHSIDSSRTFYVLRDDIEKI